ncbi:MAG: hypothetical protein M1504_02775 [Candidatus Marsarchaeota archaeon]|nr:hypothetical protein [Candidatus Marsarchaeota archaeon]
MRIPTLATEAKSNDVSGCQVLTLNVNDISAIATRGLCSEGRKDIAGCEVFVLASLLTDPNSDFRSFAWAKRFNGSHIEATVNRLCRRDYIGRFGVALTEEGKMAIGKMPGLPSDGLMSYTSTSGLRISLTELKVLSATARMDAESSSHHMSAELGMRRRSVSDARSSLKAKGMICQYGAYGAMLTQKGERILGNLNLLRDVPKLLRRNQNAERLLLGDNKMKVLSALDGSDARLGMFRIAVKSGLEANVAIKESRRLERLGFVDIADLYIKEKGRQALLDSFVLLREKGREWFYVPKKFIAAIYNGGSTRCALLEMNGNLSMVWLRRMEEAGMVMRYRHREAAPDGRKTVLLTRTGKMLCDMIRDSSN